ncbi:hypothetical protein E1301_Tti018146 [Triplophysa tibetana]|uniref:Uncharacterized protein n=1 Tax=Triplophysa tibetana TaxID=1572043 RepID=A0A5A9PJS2_9TELE|nr:hypothetical protein E1301_Tti018146 [Triplophysa tibetana]
MITPEVPRAATGDHLRERHPHPHPGVTTSGNKVVKSSFLQNQKEQGLGTMKGLVPGSKMKGVDICGVRYNCYIIRADLGYYLKTTDLRQPSDLVLYDLHDSCMGDHYVGHINEYIYIIKDSSYRKVKNLSTDSRSECKEIHPKYHFGDYYFSFRGKFYIIFKDKNIYKTTSKLTSPDCQEYPLSEDFSDGLYYWGRALHFYIMRMSSSWVVQCIKGFNLSSGNRANSASVHKDVINFLPGGLSITKGEAFGRWEMIKSVKDESDSTKNLDILIKRMVGYNKVKMREITHNWRVDISCPVNPTKLAALIAKVQFSLSAEYGGLYVNTEKESWNEGSNEVEKIKLELQPYSNVYMWQYRLGLGEDQVFFCRDIKINYDSNPPTEIPLPCAEE